MLSLLLLWLLPLQHPRAAGLLLVQDQGLDQHAAVAWSRLTAWDWAWGLTCHTLLHASSAQQLSIPPEGILLKIKDPPREILVSSTLLGNGRNGGVYESKLVASGWAVATKIFHSICPSDHLHAELEVKRLVAESGLDSLKVVMRQLYAGTVELQGKTYRCHVYEPLGQSLQQVMQASGKPFTELAVKHVAHQLMEAIKQQGPPLGGDSMYSLQHSSLRAGNILLAKDSGTATQSSSSNMRYCPIKICGLSNCKIQQQAAVSPLADATAATASAANSSTGYSSPAAVSHSGEIQAVGRLVVDLLTGGYFSLQQAGPAEAELFWASTVRLAGTWMAAGGAASAAAGEGAGGLCSPGGVPVWGQCGHQQAP